MNSYIFSRNNYVPHWACAFQKFQLLIQCASITLIANNKREKIQFHSFFCCCCFLCLFICVLISRTGDKKGTINRYYKFNFVISRLRKVRKSVASKVTDRKISLTFQEDYLFFYILHMIIVYEFILTSFKEIITSLIGIVYPLH